MDTTVKQAMTKWPNVPHCYGWLALDARGAWRMRDEEAQLHQLLGEKITHATLIDFIQRNYQSDACGGWYFQNGPQRVYVNLETTPYIARMDPMLGVVLHDGERLVQIDAVWMTEQGQLIVQRERKVAMFDDRDMVDYLPLLCIDGQPAQEAVLLNWLSRSENKSVLTMQYQEHHWVIQPVQSRQLESVFGFVKNPQAAR